MQRKLTIIKRTIAETIKMCALWGSSIKTEKCSAGIGNCYIFCKPFCSNGFILKCIIFIFTVVALDHRIATSRNVSHNMKLGIVSQDAS